MKSHCAYLQGRSRVAGCSACVDLLGAVDNIKGVAFDVPCSMCLLRRRSGVQSPAALPAEGPDTGVLSALHAPTSPTMLQVARKLWCSHCGCHFAVPKSAPASGIHPYCASSVSRTAIFSWHWCRSHVNNWPHEFRLYFHCLVHFSRQGAHVRNFSWEEAEGWESSLLICRSEPLVKVGLSPLTAI